jgi:hypothetical protein
VKRKTLLERATKYGGNWRHSVMCKAGIAKFAWLAGYQFAKRKGKSNEQ